MIILGIDPGLARIGYGVIRKQGSALSYIDAGCITTSATMPFAQRLIVINRSLKKILQRHKPDHVAIERLFFFKNAKTAFSVGQAWGVITFTVTTAALPIIELTPLQIKQAVTGYGQAPKGQVEKILKLLLKVKNLPGPDDAADAVACAYCAAQHILTHKLHP
ncbi:MAG: crossover junction endodeoxyribonuclease RuvC [Patescibacteria group bacterium]